MWNSSKNRFVNNVFQLRFAVSDCSLFTGQQVKMCTYRPLPVLRFGSLFPSARMHYNSDIQVIRSLSMLLPSHFHQSTQMNRIIVPKNTMTTGKMLEEMKKVQEEKLEKCESIRTTNVNSFTTRTFNCGELREEHIGQSVTLCGWIEYHRVAKFVIIRDCYGRIQLIIPEQDKKTQEIVAKLAYESVIQIDGCVVARPPGTENMNMSTGKIEVVVQKLSVLNPAANNLPFNVREHNKAKEPLRMQYRYLDLRYPEMQRNLRVRSKLINEMRNFLINEASFVDVETPTLFKATPGGAQEFIVPTRFPGQFYSLVQSPQQFKQILMAGGVDRYFQVARCYRDEGARPDRQPEFTQLDIEMSFTTLDGVLDLIERLLKYSWPKTMDPLKIPFDRISYKQAIQDYGTDKPDVKIPAKIIDCTEIVRNHSSLVEKYTDFSARAIVFRKPFTEFSNSTIAKFKNFTKKNYPKVKLMQQKFESDPYVWINDAKNHLGDSVPSALVDYLNLNSDECVMFLAYGNKTDVIQLLARIRMDYATYLEERGHNVRNGDDMNFLWVLDFPLFEEDENGALVSTHHPFTACHPDDETFLKTHPLKVRSLAYDLVLNGNEVGGGSIRIHNVEQQNELLKMLKIDTSTMQHFLSALSSGCPPHGGIALGLDRLLSVMLKTNSIRDVIAFPKGLEGRDPMSGAPVQISEHDQKLYHLEIVTENKDDVLLVKSKIDKS